MKQILAFFCTLLLMISLVACDKSVENQLSPDTSTSLDLLQTEEAAQVSEPSSQDISSEENLTQPGAASEDLSEKNMNKKMIVQIGSTTFTATLENNFAVSAFVKMMENAPIVIDMSDYSGFEKVGSLNADLPTSNSQTRTQSGDIVLYNGNQIVIFYGAHSWSYTRLGRIDDLSGWAEALGSGDVLVSFQLP